MLPDFFYSLDLAALKTALLAPLFRLLCGMACGLFLASFLEACKWTAYLAKIASPLAKCARLGPVSASAFTLAFFSPAAANAQLSEHFQKNELSRKELVLANLFNSLPAFLFHTPSIFFIIWPVLGNAALLYVGLTFLAAILRLAFTIIAGRVLLSPANLPPILADENYHRLTLLSACKKAWQRLKKRLPTLVYFTVPFYLLTFFCQEAGFFTWMEHKLASGLAWLSFIQPQAMGIVILQLVAEMGATLGAAGAALEAGSIKGPDIVLAMLVGNVLATPMRAIRHQLPVYAGFYKPRVATLLILTNQSLRACSVILVISLYLIIF